MKVDFHWGRLIHGDEVEDVFGAWASMGMARDVRAYGITIGWLFLGVAVFPKAARYPLVDDGIV